MRPLLSRSIYIGCLFLFAPVFPFASEPLENGDVIRLSQEGVSSSIIVDLIATSGCAFEISTESLIRLKETGVSEEVLSAMIRCNPKKEHSQSDPDESSGPTTKSIRDYENIRSVRKWDWTEDDFQALKKNVADGFSEGTYLLLEESPQNRQDSFLISIDLDSFNYHFRTRKKKDAQDFQIPFENISKIEFWMRDWILQIRVTTIEGIYQFRHGSDTMRTYYYNDDEVARKKKAKMCKLYMMALTVAVMNDPEGPAGSMSIVDKCDIY